MVEAPNSSDQSGSGAESSPDAKTGRCLCGAVRFSFTAHQPHVDACHCDTCRRHSGGPALAIRAAEKPAIEGADNVGEYHSSDWGSRSFCRICGTHLFFAAPAFGYHAVYAGTLDDLSGLTFEMELFIDKKPDLYAFANDTTKLTEAEFVAVTAGDGSGD